MVGAALTLVRERLVMVLPGWWLPRSCSPLVLASLIPLNIVLPNWLELLTGKPTWSGKCQTDRFPVWCVFLPNLSFSHLILDFVLFFLACYMVLWPIPWVLGFLESCMQCPGKPAKRPSIENGTFKKPYLLQEKKRHRICDSVNSCSNVEEISSQLL